MASGEYHADNLAPILFGGFTLVRSINPIDIVSLPCPPELIATIIHPKIELKTIHSRSILKDNSNIVSVDTFGASGPKNDVYEHFKITKEEIVKKAIRLCSK